MTWAAAGALVTAARLRPRPIGVVVVLHGVEKAPTSSEPALAPILSFSHLEAQIDWFRRHFETVTLDQLSAAVGRRRWCARIPVAITFDDDLYSHASQVMPVLERARLRATFFLGGDNTALRLAYWWEPLQLAIEQGIPLPAVGSAALAGREPTRLAAAMLDLPSTERAAITAQLWRHLGGAETTRHLGREEIAALAAAGHQIGFHTVDHEPLPALDDRDLASALSRGKDALARVSGQRVDAVAYPYGLVDDRVATAARAAGFSFGVTTDPRPVRPDSDPMRLGRVDVSEGVAALLALRVARTLHRG